MADLEIGVDIDEKAAKAFFRLVEQATRRQIREASRVERAQKRHIQEMTAGFRQYAKEQDYALKAKLAHERAMAAGMRSYEAEQRKQIRHAAQLTKTLAEANRVNRAGALRDQAAAEKAAAMAAKEHEREQKVLRQVLARGNKVLEKREKFFKRLRRARAAKAARETAAAQARLNKRWRTAGGLLRMMPGRLALIAGGLGVVGAAAVAAGAALMALKSLIVASTRSYAEFQDELFKAASAMAGVSSANVAQLGESIQWLGATTRFTTAEVAAGAKEWFRSGKSLSDWVMEGGKAVTTMAALADMSPAEAAKVTSKMMSQFNMAVSGTGHAMDVLAATASATPASVKELGNAMKFVGGLMHSQHGTLDDTISLLGALSTKLEASQAARGWRTAMMNVMRPSERAQKQLKALGLKVEDLQNVLGKPLEFTKKLVEVGASTEELANIFTSRALTVVDAMVKMEREGGQMTEIFERIQGATSGLADAMVKVQDLSLGNQFVILNSKVRVLMDAIAATSEGALRDLIKALGDLLQSLTNNADSVGEFISMIYRFMEGAVRMMTVLSDMYAAADDLGKQFGWVTDILDAFSEAVDAATGPVGALKTVFKSFSNLFRGGEKEAMDEVAGAFDTVASKQAELAKASQSWTISIDGKEDIATALRDRAVEEAEAREKIAKEAERAQQAMDKQVKAQERLAELIGLTGGIKSATNTALVGIERAKAGGLRGLQGAGKLQADIVRVFDAAVREALKKNPELAGEAQQAIDSVWHALSGAGTAFSEVEEIILDDLSKAADAAYAQYEQALLAEAAAKDAAESEKRVAKFKKGVDDAWKRWRSADQKFLKAQHALWKAKTQKTLEFKKRLLEITDAEIEAREAALAKLQEAGKAGFSGALGLFGPISSSSSIEDGVRKASASFDFSGVMSAGAEMMVGGMSDFMPKVGEVLGMALQPLHETVGLMPGGSNMEIFAKGMAGAGVGVLQGGADMLGGLMTVLGPVIGIFTGLLLAVAPLTNVVDALGALIETTLLAILPPLEPILQMFAVALAMVAPLLKSLASIMQLLTPVWQAVAIVVGGLAMGLNILLLGVTKFARWITWFLSGGTADLSGFDKTISDIEASIDEQKEMFRALATGESDALLESMIAEKRARDESTESLEKFNEELNNVPSGYKRLKLRQYENADPVYQGGRMPGTQRPRPAVSQGARGIFNRRSPQEAIRASIGTFMEV